MKTDLSNRNVAIIMLMGKMIYFGDYRPELLDYAIY